MMENNLGEAAQRYKEAAINGDANAQCNLGVCYYNGQCVSQDFAEAAKWFSKSASQGNLYAQCNLGMCYYNGRGVSQDYSEAAKWHAYFSAKTVICPTNPDQAINSTLYWKSYGMRYYGDNFSDEEGKYAYESVNGWPMGGFITTRVKNPSAVFYLGDTASIGTAVSHGGFGWRRSVDYETRKIRIMTRHSGKANMGFFDGQVAARSFNEMKNSPVKLNICYGL